MPKNLLEHIHRDHGVDRELLYGRSNVELLAADKLLHGPDRVDIATLFPPTDGGKNFEKKDRTASGTDTAQQCALLLVDLGTNEQSLLGPFGSKRKANDAIALIRKWKVVADVEVVPLDRFSMSTLRELGWL